MKYLYVLPASEVDEGGKDAVVAEAVVPDSTTSSTEDREDD